MGDFDALFLEPGKQLPMPGGGIGEHLVARLAGIVFQ
jgi:hypothetical protein